jgi:hypothetical protein
MLRNVGERLRSRGVALVDRARSVGGDVLGKVSEFGINSQ